MNNSHYGGDTLRHFNTAMASIAHFAGETNWSQGPPFIQLAIPVGFFTQKSRFEKTVEPLVPDDPIWEPFGVPIGDRFDESKFPKLFWNKLAGLRCATEKID